LPMLQPGGLVAAITLGLIFSHTTYSRDDSDVITELGLQESAVPVRDMGAWRKPKKIVVLIDSPARLQWFHEALAGTEVELFGAHNPAEFLAMIKGADAVEGLCNADIIAADANLRWIQTQGAGVEGCLANPRVASGDILLTNMQRVDSSSVAEHTLALILALSRQLPAYVSSQRRRTWGSRLSGDMVSLQGGTILIIGLGGNGTAVAERAHAFGMHIIATRPNGPPELAFVDYIGAPDELASLIGRADVVVNAAPLTPQTTGLFNAAMFDKMKRTALFINVGRGKSVITMDLVRALNDGRIAGAGLDVVDPEPLPPGHPLWQARNVIITPHVAGRSTLSAERSWIVMRENLRRYIRGEKLLSIVDPKRGY
jgi:phosphoglycerate dehydrogenase-like enzyme